MTWQWVPLLDGAKLDKQMAALLAYRQTWLAAHPEAPQCIVIVAKSQSDTVGAWLSEHEVPWATIAGKMGRIAPGTVGLTEDADGVEMGV